MVKVVVVVSVVVCSEVGSGEMERGELGVGAERRARLRHVLRRQPACGERVFLVIGMSGFVTPLMLHLQMFSPHGL